MNWQQLIFGRLTWDAAPHEWFTIGGTGFVTLAGIVTIIYLTKTKKWTWLWKDWLTSVDPKRIGIMYLIVATLMLFRGGLDAVMIWLQQSLASGNTFSFLGATHGYLDPTHFQEIATAHGNIMVFFVVMGFLFGLINIILPLQIGARDVASPLLNTLGFWLYVAGVTFVNLFFIVGGHFAPTGWLAIAPLSELQYNPGPGVDYWIWSLQISGLGTLLGGINFVMTILKMRAPGMKLLDMPMFTWASFYGMGLVVTIFPILTMILIILSLDRVFGMHFFTNTNGGSPMMYVNLIWTWGHPEVYVLVLPLYGVWSEIVSTFSQKKIFGYVMTIFSIGLVWFFSMLVWLHHFFTMGAGADVNAFFGIMTEFIAIPTGILVFTWIFTMFKGRVQFKSPMYWFFGFIAIFSLGGLAGIMLGIPPIDFQVHNSLFLVAHFHTMAVGGGLFGVFAGITYWFPKIAGFRLNEKIGKYAFWLWLIGFFVSFVPLYTLGIMGVTRRLDHYTNAAWQPLFIVSFIGSLIIASAVAMQILQIVVSIKQRKQNTDKTDDPWNARTLEWLAHSPPPVYNFAIVPKVNGKDAFWEMKQDKNYGKIKPKYEDIHMPKNTGAGVYISAFIFLIGFGMVWHIFWLAIFGVIGALAAFIIRAFDDHTSYTIPAAEVAKIEAEYGR